MIAHLIVGAIMSAPVPVLAGPAGAGRLERALEGSRAADKERLELAERIRRLGRIVLPPEGQAEPREGRPRPVVSAGGPVEVREPAQAPLGGVHTRRPATTAPNVSSPAGTFGPYEATEDLHESGAGGEFTAVEVLREHRCLLRSARELELAQARAARRAAMTTAAVNRVRGLVARREAEVERARAAVALATLVLVVVLGLPVLARRRLLAHAPTVDRATVPNGSVGPFPDLGGSMPGRAGAGHAGAGRRAGGGSLSRRAPAWTHGASTDAGRVRRNNEDFVQTFMVGPWSVALLADGMGGTPRGADAAHLAVVRAARALGPILRELKPEADPGTAIEQAFLGAERALAERGDLLGITETSGGLRSTLVVVVLGPQRGAAGWLGDGAVVLVRRGGGMEQLLVPHRPPGAAANVLEGSLGPRTAGRPRIVKFDADDVALAFAATDGVSEYVELASFGRGVLRLAIELEGDFEAVAKRAVADLVAATDSDGDPVLADNATLALLGSGGRPQLGPDFWTVAPRLFERSAHERECV